MIINTLKYEAGMGECEDVFLVEIDYFGAGPNSAANKFFRLNREEKSVAGVVDRVGFPKAGCPAI